MLARLYKKKGFSLIELIVVLTLMALIAAIAAPSIGSFSDSAQGRNCAVAIRRLANALHTAVVETRFERHEGGDVHYNLTQAIKQTAEEFEGSALTLNTTASGYELAAAHTCPNDGVYTIAWSYTDTTESGRIMTTAVRLTIGCDKHADCFEIVNATASYALLTGSRLTMPDYVEIMHDIYNAFVANWNSTGGNNGKKAQGAWAAVKAMLEDFIIQYPELLTKNLDAFYAEMDAYVGVPPGHFKDNQQTVIWNYIDKRLFEYYLAPKLTYNGKEYPIIVRTQSFYSDPTEYLYMAYVNYDGSGNESYNANETAFTFVYCRKYNAAKTAVVSGKWYMVNSSNPSKLASYSLHLTGRNQAFIASGTQGDFGGNSTVTEYVTGEYAREGATTWTDTSGSFTPKPQLFTEVA